MPTQDIDAQMDITMSASVYEPHSDLIQRMKRRVGKNAGKKPGWGIRAITL